MKHLLKSVHYALVLMPLLASCSSLPVTNNDYILEEDKKLTVYTSHKEVYSPIIKSLKKGQAYGCSFCGGTSEILDKLAESSSNM